MKEDKIWFEFFWYGDVKKVLSQSDCRIFESTISKVKTDESAWVLEWGHRFKKRKGGL